jgi:hypothetical protein
MLSNAHELFLPLDLLYIMRPLFGHLLSVCVNPAENLIHLFFLCQVFLNLCALL